MTLLTKTSCELSKLNLKKVIEQQQKKYCHVNKSLMNVIKMKLG